MPEIDYIKLAKWRYEIYVKGLSQNHWPPSPSVEDIYFMETEDGVELEGKYLEDEENECYLYTNYFEKIDLPDVKTKEEMARIIELKAIS